MRHLIAILSILSLAFGLAAQAKTKTGGVVTGGVVTGKTADKTTQGADAKEAKGSVAKGKDTAGKVTAKKSGSKEPGSKKGGKKDSSATAKAGSKAGDSKKGVATAKTQKTEKTAKTQKTEKTEKKAAEEAADDEDIFPAGADPADLVAIRGFRKMLKAEKRLAKLLKAGKIKGIDRILPFEEISSWPYEDQLKGMPKKLKKLDGKKVMMTGFMLPIDDVENIKEFLLVQSLWSCCYGQPPDINGTVRVIMKGKKRTDYIFDPIKLIGTFRIKPTIEDGFCVDIYQLEVEKVEVIK